MIVGVTGSPSIAVCVVALGRTKLLFAMGVAVSIAGSLEAVEETVPSDVEEPDSDAVALEVCWALLRLDGAAVDDAAL